MTHLQRWCYALGCVPVYDYSIQLCTNADVLWGKKLSFWMFYPQEHCKHPLMFVFFLLVFFFFFENTTSLHCCIGLKINRKTTGPIKFRKKGLMMKMKKMKEIARIAFTERGWHLMVNHTAEPRIYSAVRHISATKKGGFTEHLGANCTFHLIIRFKTARLHHIKKSNQKQHTVDWAILK